MAGLQLKPGTSWSETYARCVAEAPEAFESDRLLNLFDGRWQRVGRPGYHVNPVDGSPIQGPPQIDQATAVAAVDAAGAPARGVVEVELDERKERVTAALDAMAGARDLLALLLVWEIGKPWRLACADVDRGIDGVRWYVEEIDRQLEGGRTPLPGPGVEHRQLELPGERAGARRAGPGVGGQRRRREDAHPGRVPLPDPRARLHGPGRPAGDAAVGSGVQARRGAGQQRPARRAGVRRRPLERSRRRRPRSRTASAGTSSSRRVSTPGGSGTSGSGRCWPSTSARASSTPSNGAPPTRASSYSAVCCRRSSRRISRCWTICGSATRWPSPPRTTRCRSWTSGP